MPISLNSVFHTLLAFPALYCMSAFASATNLPKSIHIGGVSTISSPPYTWINRCENSINGSSRHLLNKLLTEIGIEVSYAEPLSVRSPILRDRFKHLLEGKFDALVGIYPSQATEDIILSSDSI